MTGIQRMFAFLSITSLVVAFILAEQGNLDSAGVAVGAAVLLFMGVIRAG